MDDQELYDSLENITQSISKYDLEPVERPSSIPVKIPSQHFPSIVPFDVGVSSKFKSKPLKKAFTKKRNPPNSNKSLCNIIGGDRLREKTYVGIFYSRTKTSGVKSRDCSETSRAQCGDLSARTILSSISAVTHYSDAESSISESTGYTLRYCFVIICVDFLHEYD